MTRNEAKKVIENLNESGPLFILAAIEALGLIKFDEEVKEPTNYEYIIFKQLSKARCLEPSVKSAEIVNALIDAGYQIVRRMP